MVGGSGGDHCFGSRDLLSEYPPGDRDRKQPIYGKRDRGYDLPEKYGLEQHLLLSTGSCEGSSAIPFVEDYKLVFQNPFHVQVIIHEKTVVGYVSYMSSFMYFDKDGIVVESTNQKLDGIPCITGLKFGHIVLHQPLPVEEKSVFESILNVTQVLETYNLKVDKIQYNSKGEATLYMKDLEVALGDSKDISGKISELSDMMPELEGKKGILYLDTYDPVNPPSMYTMKRKP